MAPYVVLYYIYRMYMIRLIGNRDETDWILYRHLNGWHCYGELCLRTSTLHFVLLGRYTTAFWRGP